MYFNIELNNFFSFLSADALRTRNRFRRQSVASSGSSADSPVNSPMSIYDDGNLLLFGYSCALLSVIFKKSLFCDGFIINIFLFLFLNVYKNCFLLFDKIINVY